MEVNLGSSSNYDYSNPYPSTSESPPLRDSQLTPKPVLINTSIKHFVEQIEGDFKRENYAQVLENLSTLVLHYSVQEGAPVEDTHMVYSFVKHLIPQLEVDALNKFITQLTNFLIKTSAFPEEHLEVANLIGTQYIRHKNGKAAMHYFAKAFVIAKWHDLREETPSSQFLSCIFEEKIKRVFQKTIEVAVGNNDTQLFETQLDRICQLQAFCQPNDYSCIQSLYKQAQQAISNVKSQYQESFSPLLGTIIKGLTQPFVSPETLPLAKYRKALEEFRAQFKQLYTAQQNILDSKGVRQLQKEIAQNFKTLFKVFLVDIFAILGEPTFDYDFRAMGSVGREEMCPYSDLEWFALISKSEFQPEIKAIAELLELQVISLGETAIKNPVCFKSVPVKSGFHIDIGGNPAQTSSLIGIPSDLAKEQAPFEQDQMIAANDISSTMRKSASLASKGNLIEQYEQESRDRLVTSLPAKEITSLYKTVGERRAIRFLENHLKDFKEIWKGSPEGIINLKAQYVELINHLMTTFALFYNLSETNTLDIIDKLTQKQIFTPYSGQLLKETVAGVYMIRVRTHFFYEEQKEEIPFDKLNRAEQDLLTRSYWIILRPLYQLIEEWFETKKPLFQVDFLDLAIEKISADLSLSKEAFLKPYTNVISLMASLISSTDDPYPQHLKVYQKLSQFSNFESLRETYLNQVDRKTLEVLLEIPNRAGLRYAYVREYQNFEQAFTSLTTTQSFPGAIKVTTSFLEKDKIYYLKLEVAKAILEKGKIRRQYSNSAHSVFHYPTSYCDFHFKGIPSHPMMEYAMHALTSRIMGKGTPPVHLIRLDTEAGPYPVLISETIPGKPLGQESPSFDLKHLTWTLLCQVITHPGDGRPPNFVVDEKGRLFCVDNDVSLMEAMVDKTVYFASAPFCAKGKINGKEEEVLTTPLDQEVLKQFCTLAVPLILREWLDEVIEKEAQMLNLFDKKERENLFREDPSNLAKLTGWFTQEDQQKLFTPRILFQKGTIASLCTQFLSLQRTLSEKLLKNAPITPLDLLDSLTTLGKKTTQQASLGMQVRKVYTQAQNWSTLEKRYQQITGRAQSISQAKSHTITFGKPLNIQEIEAGETYSPTQAKEELRVANLNWLGNAKVTKDGKDFTLKVDFSNIKQKGLPDTERQQFLLNGLKHWVELCKSKPVEVHITHCKVINDRDLLPFLHQDLKLLNLTGCLGISDTLILQIEKNCPELQELSLSETDIIAFVRSTFLSSSSIEMRNLRILHLSRCSKLNTIKLDTPLLGQLKAKESERLKLIEFSDLYAIEVNKESRTTMSLKNQTKLDISPITFATYEKAVIGDASAQASLAISFHRGDGVSQNNEKCIYWHERAVANNPQAQTELAIRFHKGDGVSQNNGKCLYWHERAVANNPQAQTELAIRFHRGDGVNQNLDQAIHWSQKAASNEAKARSLLAQCYTENPANLDYITDLDLHNFLEVTDEVLESLVKKCPNLTNLNLSGCKQITDGGLAHLKTLTSLQQLNLSGSYSYPMKITDKGLAHLKTLTSLQQLNLSWCNQITNRGLAHLKTLTSLQQLNLYRCDKITDGGLAHLKTFISLQQLNLSCCNKITDGGLAHIKTLTSLQQLNLSYCDKITSRGLAHLKTLISLQQLNLSWCNQITDEGLDHIKTLTSLQQLNLDYCNKITDGGLAHIKTLTSLQQFNLSWCNQITDGGLAHIKTLISLQQLNLSWCNQITDGGLDHIKTLTSLQQLNLDYCNKITDGGLAHIKTLKQLKIIR